AERRVEDSTRGLISVMNLHDPNENRAVTVLEKVAHFVPDALLRVRLKRFVSASRDLTHPLPEPHHLVGVNSIEVHGEHAFTSHTSWSSGHDLMTPNDLPISGPGAAETVGRR